MANYTLMSLINWLEGLACKSFYAFKGGWINPRCCAQPAKAMSEVYLAICTSLTNLCLDLQELASSGKGGSND